jgi:hypothetical protein
MKNFFENVVSRSEAGCHAKGTGADALKAPSRPTAADIEQEQRNEKTDTSVGMPTMQLRDAEQDRARDRRRAGAGRIGIASGV